jgi:hypothetical protein
MQILALPLITTQLMRAREVAFDHDFKKSGHMYLAPKVLLN